jgi:hypothetical protein
MSTINVDVTQGATDARTSRATVPVTRFWRAVMRDMSTTNIDVTAVLGHVLRRQSDVTPPRCDMSTDVMSIDARR